MKQGENDVDLGLVLTSDFQHDRIRLAGSLGVRGVAGISAPAVAVDLLKDEALPADNYTGRGVGLDLSTCDDSRKKSP